ncbi:MAG: ethanolamine utilization protein EutJ, partial [Verrucomicrobiaceae bacterium]
MKKATLLLLGLAAVLTGAGCKKAGNSANSNEIPIGEYASLTGQTASFGQSSHKGTDLAIEEVNAAGGVLGKPLKLYTEDDQSKAGEAATVVRKLISRNDVVAVLG